MWMQTYLHGIHLEQHKQKLRLTFLRNLNSEGQRFLIKVVDGVVIWHPLLSYIIKHFR